MDRVILQRSDLYGKVKRGTKNIQLDLQRQLLRNEFNSGVARFTTHEIDLHVLQQIRLLQVAKILCNE